jgi:hypothetical protein
VIDLILKVKGKGGRTSDRLVLSFSPPKMFYYELYVRTTQSSTYSTKESDTRTKYLKCVEHNNTIIYITYDYQEKMVPAVVKMRTFLNMCKNAVSAA